MEFLLHLQIGSTHLHLPEAKNNGSHSCVLELEVLVARLLAIIICVFYVDRCCFIGNTFMYVFF
jgi:hypothetical protein